MASWPQLLISGRRRRRSAAIGLAPDILASFLISCSSGPLAFVFGETDVAWSPRFFRNDVPAYTNVISPYLVARVDVVGASDEPDYDGVTVGPVTIQVSVYAASQGEAIRLARRVNRYFRDDPDADDLAPLSSPLEWRSGVELYRTPLSPNPEEIGQQRGPAGMVFGSRIRIEFMTQFAVFGQIDQNGDNE